MSFFKMEKIIYTGDNNTLENTRSHCRMCELVCSLHHYGQANPKRSRIRLVKVELDDAMPVTCLQCKGAPVLVSVR
jgi:Fe-S-cluster-containing hydrogenase component 2